MDNPISEPEVYYIADKKANAEWKERGSKFLTYVFPIETAEDFKISMTSVKAEHQKATHHCFAYRIGLDRNKFRINDDGEPSGTAGRTILEQIDSRRLTNTLVIVVRYFGGTLLGIPGLISAYRTAASLALQVTPIVQRQVEIIYQLQFDYTITKDVMAIVKLYNCTIIHQDMQLFCVVTIGIPKNRLEETLCRFRTVPNLHLDKVTFMNT